MALNFSANQFEKEYRARRLRNWEPPKWYPARPRARLGPTKVIANDRGHLLPGVARPPVHPWVNYVSTWKLPKHVTKDFVNEYHAKYLAKSKSWQQRSAHADIINQAPKCPKKAGKEGKQQATPREDQHEKAEPKPGETSAEEPHQYIPGDLTEPQHRAPNYEVLRKQKTIEESLQELREASEMEEKQTNSAKSCKEHRKKLYAPFACTYRNFEMAKKCAKENLEHHPLPDTVADAMFRKLQIEGASNPGLALPGMGEATGIGWKGYGAAGPTQCTKMRIYRPKTTAHLSKKGQDDDPRPGSCGTFDLKWRFIKQKNVTPIDLAICWDMRPENPGDEPKRTPHIDGSNGSAAPAVFAMVHSPKQEADSGGNSRKSSMSKAACDGVHGCGTIKSGSCGSGLEKSKLIDPNNNSLNKRSTSSNSLYVNHPMRKSSQETLMTQSSKSNLNDNRKIHQSSPNLSTVSGESACKECLLVKRKKNGMRVCAACEAGGETREDRAKSEYKMAFKAGKFVDRSVDSSEDASSGSKSGVKVPKQRDPYAKRSYDIKSLTPPFSIWRGTSYPSYPEHWRLASVYQHSYKPVEARKRPLLASVYQ